jgi:hypothetical protein
MGPRVPTWKLHTQARPVTLDDDPRRPFPEPSNKAGEANPYVPTYRLIDLTAAQVGPTHGQAGNNGGLGGRCQRLAAVRADSVMARSPRGLQRSRPKIRL